MALTNEDWLRSASPREIAETIVKITNLSLLETNLGDCGSKMDNCLYCPKTAEECKILCVEHWLKSTHKDMVKKRKGKKNETN